MKLTCFIDISRCVEHISTNNTTNLHLLNLIDKNLSTSILFFIFKLKKFTLLFYSWERISYRINFNNSADNDGENFERIKISNA